MEILTEAAFQSRIAQEVGRPGGRFVSAATLLGDLDLDDFELLRIRILVERLVPGPLPSEPDWEQLTLGELYKLYVLQAVHHAMASEPRSSSAEEDSSS